MPFGICRNVRLIPKGGGDHRGSAGSRLIRKEDPAKPATGPGSHPGLASGGAGSASGRIKGVAPERACGGFAVS